MTSTFTGFSEEDLKRIKLIENGQSIGPQINEVNTSNIKKLDKIGGKPKRPLSQYRLTLQKQNSDDAIDNIDFNKCKLSLGNPNLNKSNNSVGNGGENETDKIPVDFNDSENKNNGCDKNNDEPSKDIEERRYSCNDEENVRKCSSNSTPDIVRGVNNYSEEELVAHKVKLEELQLKQRLMEEQNKKRKEMLAKALADRTKQTEEEVVRLEKIKKELQVLDGQFSQDVAVLRKRIDQACISYSEAEKHYLRVEKEFLQAKINLQKEKEKKELLTEHLCALITHNETRKAQKLETLMLELATDKKHDNREAELSVDDEEPIIVDGVDERTGKIVELPIVT